MRRYSLQQNVTGLAVATGWTGISAIGPSLQSFAGGNTPLMVAGGTPSVGGTAIATPFGAGFQLVPGVTYGYKIRAASNGALCDVALLQQPGGTLRIIGAGLVNPSITDIEGTFVAAAGDGVNPGLALRAQSATAGSYFIGIAEIYQDIYGP